MANKSVKKVMPQAMGFRIRAKVRPPLIASSRPCRSLQSVFVSFGDPKRYDHIQ